MLNDLGAEDQIEAPWLERARRDVVTKDRDIGKDGGEVFEVGLCDVRCGNRLEVLRQGREIDTRARPDLQRGASWTGGAERRVGFLEV